MSASRRGFLQSLFGAGVAVALPNVKEAVANEKPSNWAPMVEEFIKARVISKEDARVLLAMPDIDCITSSSHPGAIRNWETGELVDVFTGRKWNRKDYVK